MDASARNDDEDRVEPLPDRPMPTTLSYHVGTVVARWLRAHPANPKVQPTPVYLVEDVTHGRWLVRFPTGMLGWRTAAWLTARGFACPERPILGRLTTEE